MEKEEDEEREKKESGTCRSRRELSSEYLLAKFGFDAAESEPLGIWNLDGNLGIWTGENSYSNSQITVGIGNLNCGASNACRIEDSKFFLCSCVCTCMGAGMRTKLWTGVLVFRLERVCLNFLLCVWVCLLAGVPI